MNISHVFFDVGGVLGTNGWDQHQRAAAVARFGLDAAELAARHEESVAVWETGGMSMDEYLDHTVFYRARSFTRDDFRTFMMTQSVAFPETIAVAHDLARAGRYRMLTINNESAELNTHRIKAFGLRDIFVAFFTSCWMGVLKPARQIYERALAISRPTLGRRCSSMTASPTSSRPGSSGCTPFYTRTPRGCGGISRRWPWPSEGGAA